MIQSIVQMVAGRMRLSEAESEDAQCVAMLMCVRRISHVDNPHTAGGYFGWIAFRAMRRFDKRAAHRLEFESTFTDLGFEFPT